MPRIANLHPAARGLGKARDRDAWLELRRAGLGGSDAAVVLGRSPWTKAPALLDQKTGRIKERSLGFSERYAQLGVQLEAAVLAALYSRESYVDGSAIGTLRSRAHDHLLANVDGVLLTDGQPVLIEVKTTGARKQDDWSSGVPIYYQDQVQHYLLVMGLTRAVVVQCAVELDRPTLAILIERGLLTPQQVVESCCTISEHWLDADPAWQEAYLPLSLAFWQEVEAQRSEAAATAAAKEEVGF